MNCFRKILIFFALVLGGGALWMGLKIDWQIFSSHPKIACPFCNEGVLELNTFYKGKFALGLLTHKPGAPGHVLIIPKRHVIRFEDLTNEELIEMKEIIRKIDAMSRKLYGTTAYLLIEKNGREAGQSVPHVHFHYIPRMAGQNHLIFALKILIEPYMKPLSPEEMKKQAALLAQAIKE